MIPPRPARRSYPLPAAAENLPFIEVEEPPPAPPVAAAPPPRPACHYAGAGSGTDAGTRTCARTCPVSSMGPDAFPTLAQPRSYLPPVFESEPVRSSPPAYQRPCPRPRRCPRPPPCSWPRPRLSCRSRVARPVAGVPCSSAPVRSSGGRGLPLHGRRARRARLPLNRFLPRNRRRPRPSLRGRGPRRPQDTDIRSAAAVRHHSRSGHARGRRHRRRPFVRSHGAAPADRPRSPSEAGGRRSGDRLGPRDRAAAGEMELAVPKLPAADSLAPAKAQRDPAAIKRILKAVGGQ